MMSLKAMLESPLFTGHPVAAPTATEMALGVGMRKIIDYDPMNDQVYSGERHPATHYCPAADSLRPR
jgi:hypothetical protein